MLIQEWHEREGCAASWRPAFTLSFLIALLGLICATTGCRQEGEKQSVRPRSLRDVPAQRLAYRFEGDTSAPAGATAEDQSFLPPVQNDFNARRKDDALVRTVQSPDGQRALALYETGDDRPGEFRIDLYSADGNFLRNITPPDLSGAFPLTVAWSPDGNSIAFIGRKSLKPLPTPTPLDDLPGVIPEAPSPTASIAPVFAPVPVFNTEQVYTSNRDGFDLKPLTTRDGLVYFYFAWASDGHALVSLACKDDEWNAREKQLAASGENMRPQGRPRLITLDGHERLLDDSLTEVLPVWSPDASKVATAFETDVVVYDASTVDNPTGARIALRDPLVTASVAYDENKLHSKAQSTGLPVSFNPVIRLEWPQPETLYLQTAYVRNYKNDPVKNFPRWHILHLSPQAALLGYLQLHTGPTYLWPDHTAWN